MQIYTEWEIYSCSSSQKLASSSKQPLILQTRRKSYLMSGSSFSSLLGVSFRLPFLARGQPDKLDTEIITCQTSDKFSGTDACMKKIRLFGCIKAFKGCHSHVETRPRSCQSQNVTCVFHHAFICIGGEKTLAVRKITQINCEVLEVRSLLPSMGCIVSCNMTWTIAARGWAPVYEKVDNKYHGTKPIH